MSMIGEYLRLQPAELARALQDPAWALEFAQEIQDTEESDGSPPHEARLFSTHQTWDLLGFLLRRRGFPVDIVHGEEPFTDEDWGYGPPRFLPADRVRVAAETLSRTTYDDLVNGVHHQELQEAGVYPLGWDTPASLDWARDRFSLLTAFFEAAATDGDSILLWLD
ncbi:YfbM family protein [Streptacidiphilus sp. N1-12]|uniref:YfbM family protein n=2 Tax=Streptacidiphilus alkalitolerans TaxID=3342712 RepID=A0ABV6V9K3_9ACTN